MRRETQINNIKNYSEHLKRLMKMNRHLNVRGKDEAQKESLIISKHKSSKSRRYMTEQADKKECKLPTNRVPLTLPLVGLTERELLNKSLSVRKIPQRDAQIVLENYLLSKRLLKAKPSINKIDHDKDYQKHERYSLLRSKSKLEEIKLSQSRLLKFKEFESAQRRKISSRLSSTLGIGKYLFTLKINSFQRIHKKEDKGSLYNLILKLGKRSFTYKHLSLRGLTQSRSFYFRKRDLKFPNLLFGQFDEVIQTDCIKIGNFSIDLNEVYQKLSSLEKESEFKYEKEDQIEGIRSSRNELLVGTIALNFSISKIKE